MISKKNILRCFPFDLTKRNRWTFRTTGGADLRQRQSSFHRTAVGTSARTRRQTIGRETILRRSRSSAIWFVDLPSSTRETKRSHLGNCLHVRALSISVYLCLSGVFRGSALSCKLDQLRSNSSYEFRIQYKISSTGVERSDWSSILQASTTPEPMTGDTMFKAIAVPGREQLEKLIQVL